MCFIKLTTGLFRLQDAGSASAQSQEVPEVQEGVEAVQVVASLDDAVRRREKSARRR